MDNKSHDHGEDDDLYWLNYTWPLPHLTAHQNYLTCPICHELFTAAMTFSTCSHTFCSLCIRRAMDYRSMTATKTSCPLCHSTSVSSSCLYNNHLIDHLVKNFVEMRPVLARSLEKATATAATEVTSENSHDSGRKEKKSHTLTLDEMAPFLSMNHHHHHSHSTTTATTTHSHVTTAMQLQNRHNRNKTLSKKRRRSDDTISSSSSNANADMNGDDAPIEQRNEVEVEEEMSQLQQETKRIKTMIVIDDNDDNDDNNSTMTHPVHDMIPPSNNMNSAIQMQQLQQLSLRKSEQFSNLKPIVSPVYSLMSLKNLRDALRRFGMSDKGEKDDLIWRHREYVLQYNANLDLLEPKPIETIAAIVNRNEQLRKQQQQQQHQTISSKGKPLQKSIISMFSSSSSSSLNKMKMKEKSKGVSPPTTKTTYSSIIASIKSRSDKEQNKVMKDETSEEQNKDNGCTNLVSDDESSCDTNQKGVQEEHSQETNINYLSDEPSPSPIPPLKECDESSLQDEQQHKKEEGTIEQPMTTVPAVTATPPRNEEPTEAIEQTPKEEAERAEQQQQPQEQTTPKRVKRRLRILNPPSSTSSTTSTTPCSVLGDDAKRNEQASSMNEEGNGQHQRSEHEAEEKENMCHQPPPPPSCQEDNGKQQPPVFSTMISSQ